MSITGCSLPSSGSNETNSNTNSGNSGSVVDTANDVAIHVLNLVSFFPEIGDSIDFGDYLYFDAGFGHTLSEYTFKSSDPTVIKVTSYNATVLKNGLATVTITGPGIKKALELTFYVGSVAGTYVPDSSRIKDKIALTIGEIDKDTRTADFSLSIKEGKFNSKSNLNPYEGGGTFTKLPVGILSLDFEGDKPADVRPLTDALSLFGIDGFQDQYGITQSIYGLMVYDIDQVMIRMLVKGEVIDFLPQK